jgi:hypothetical protein
VKNQHVTKVTQGLGLGQVLWHGWERYKMCTKFWSENLKGGDNLEDPGIDGKIILEWILGK